MANKKFNRRDFLRAAGVAGVGGLAAACAAPTPQVVEKVVTQVVEKQVTQQVEKVVEKPVVQTQVVEKVLTAPPPKESITVTVTMNANLLTEADAIAEGQLFTIHLMEHNLKLKDKGIQARYEPWAGGDDYEKKVRLMTASGEIKDYVVWCNWKGVASYARDKVLQPIDDLMKAANLKVEDWGPVSSKLLMYDVKATKPYSGPVWGLPTQVNPGLCDLVYNVDMLDAAGLKAPTDDTTLKDLEAMATKASNPAKGIFGLNWNAWGNTHGLGWELAYVGPFGGRVIDETGKKCLLNSPECLTAYKWLSESVTTKHFCPTPAEYKTLGDYIQGMQANKLAMYRMGPWGVTWPFTRGKNEKPHAEFCLAPSTYDSSTKNATRGNGLEVDAYGISVNAKNPAACMEVLYAITDKDAGEFQLKAGVAQPSCRPDVQSNPEMDKHPIVKGAAKAATTAALQQPPANGRSSEVDKIIAQRFGLIDTGEVKPDQAWLDKVVAEVQAILDKPPA